MGRRAGLRSCTSKGRRPPAMRGVSRAPGRALRVRAANRATSWALTASRFPSHARTRSRCTRPGFRSRIFRLGDRQSEPDTALAPGGVQAGDYQVGLASQGVVGAENGARSLGQAIAALAVVASLGDTVGIDKGKDAPLGDDPGPGNSLQPRDQALQLCGGAIARRQAARRPQ
jgi:hypothetical protein